jgi:hypothetical protein
LPLEQFSPNIAKHSSRDGSKNFPFHLLGVNEVCSRQHGG